MRKTSDPYLTLVIVKGSGMKAILFRDCKACFQSFKNWGMVLIIMVTAIFVEMVASGAGILDPFTWAVFLDRFSSIRHAR